MTARFWKRVMLWVLLVPALAFTALVASLYWKQEALVQELVGVVNNDFEGELAISGSHISPFANFPYISIDLEQVKVFEYKTKATPPLVDVHDVYLGFNLWDVLVGKLDIKSIKLKDGFIKLVQHTDGTFNIANALSSKKEIEDVNEEFHLQLQSILLENIDLIKLNEANNILLDFFVSSAKSQFKTSPNHLMVALQSNFVLTLIIEDDTTFVHNKHFELSTQLDYTFNEQLLMIHPSEVKLEQALFRMEGSIDMDDDMNLNVRFEGEKSNFDLFMAFAPEELVPILRRYENGGNVYFRTHVSGKSTNGHKPMIEAEFGCEAAFFDNKESGKKLDELYFKGHFTNGVARDVTTMEFSLLDISAKPEAGVFSGSLLVRNFQSPEIDLKLHSEFELDFLANFLNLTELQGLTGSVALTMNFHDIMDLDQPEKSIERLNESYFTELDVKNLSFRLPSFHLPVHNVTIKASMDGHEANLQQLSFKVGDSDIRLSGTISDLPAILHHLADPVLVALNIESSLLDIRQLTSGDTLIQKPYDEQVRDLKMKFNFKSSARAFTESPHLPIGEFFIEDLYAKLTHYPHAFHDFHADVFIDDHDFRVIDFTGMIDKSDFHFSGKLNNYDLWFSDAPLGDTNIEFNLTSALLHLEDFFFYGGENYVPEDYRHEEFRNLKLHGFAALHFNQGLKSSDIMIDRLEASMKVHPMRLEKFKGRVHYEDEHLVIESLSGKIGKSEFTTHLNYYLGQDDAVRKRDNYFSLKAPRLDFDELFNYNPAPGGKTPGEHDAGFNIFEFPFTDMKAVFDIGMLNYHRHHINNLTATTRIQKNHYLYIDTLSLQASGGSVGLKGYFNGSDKNKIYFSPELSLENIDLDQLLFKFDNFGQDQLVSENLHGQLSGKLTGKLRMHTDLVPIINESEIHIDMNVKNGRLENYSAFDALADYFRDKNLKKVLFDTLRNHIDVTNGVMTIPNMTINSSLGFIDVSGKQDMDQNMEYYIRVPLKLVTQVGLQRLFGEKKEIDADVEDEIQYKDATKQIRFVNLKIVGTPDNYKITVGKDTDMKKK